MTTQEVERLAFSPSEAAAAVGLSVGTIRKLIKAGKLGYTRYERRFLISRENLASFLGQEKEKRRSSLERIKEI